MCWLYKSGILVRAVSRTHASGRTAEVQNTVKDETVVGLQPEMVGGHVPTRSGPISAIAAALHFLAHPRTRKSAAEADAEASAEQTRRPERDRAAYRSPMEAGITGGFSLLMDNPNARRRR